MLFFSCIYFDVFNTKKSLQGSKTRLRYSKMILISQVPKFSPFPVTLVIILNLAMLKSSQVMYFSYICSGHKIFFLWGTKMIDIWHEEYGRFYYVWLWIPIFYVSVNCTVLVMTNTNFLGQYVKRMGHSIKYRYYAHQIVLIITY